MKAKSTKAAFFALVMAVSLTLTACSDGAEPSSTTEPTQAETVATSATEVETEAATEAPTEETTAPPTEPETAPSTEPTEPTTEAPTEPQVIEANQDTVYLELAVSEISLSQIDDSFYVPYTIRNGSSKDLYTGTDYAIERHDGGQWVPFPFADDVAWPAELLYVPAGGTLEGTMHLTLLEEEITPGDYRIVKIVSEDGKPEFALHADFTVLGDAETAVAAIGNPTPGDFEGEDFFLHDGIVCIRADEIAWIQELDLTEGEPLGEIKRTGHRENYSDWDATDLPVGTKIYQHPEERLVLIVAHDGAAIPYMKMIEG
jgi:hypothetical protein